MLLADSVYQEQYKSALSRAALTWYIKLDIKYLLCSKMWRVSTDSVQSLTKFFLKLKFPRQPGSGTQRDSGIFPALQSISFI